jgi:ketosteroid isomerase-like protein
LLSHPKGGLVPTTDDEIRELERRWSEGETRGDSAALADLVTDDFVLVGPLGFVLDRQQWLDRYRHGDLVTHALSFEDTATRVWGDAAVTIGRHVQRAEYQGRPADGEFRATHIAIRAGTQWQLAGMHLSPIGGPPPFAGRGTGAKEVAP